MRALFISLILSTTLYASFGQTKNEIFIAQKTINKLMYVNTNYIKTYKENNKSIIVLQSKSKKSNYYGVKIEGNKIIWRIEKDSNSIKKGRWRISGSDEKVVYKITGNELILDVVYSDGSVDRSKYLLK